MAKLATGPNTPRARLLAAMRPVADPKPGARAIAEPSANGIDIARTPSKTLVRNARHGHRPAPDRAVDGMVEDLRQDGRPRPPQPAAIRREDVRLPQRK